MSLHARKGNRQVTIKQENVEEFAKQGYEVFEWNGKKKKVLRSPEKDTKELQAENKKLVKENKDLRDEVVKLKAQIEELNKPE